MAFMSDRGSKTQVYALRLEGGEPKAITHEEEGVSGFEWHPSGESIVFLKPEKEDK